jgi:hypothetical protein
MDPNDTRDVFDLDDTHEAHRTYGGFWYVTNGNGHFVPLSDAAVRELYRLTEAERTAPVELVAAYYADGAFYGASATCEAATEPRYWLPLWNEDEPFRLVRLVNVPADVAAQFVAHGTSEQHYADGYEAARAAAPYEGAELYRSDNYEG